MIFKIFLTCLTILFYSASLSAQTGVLRPENLKKEKNYKYKGLSREERKKLRAKESKFRKPSKEEALFFYPSKQLSGPAVPLDKPLKLFVWNIQKNVKPNWGKILREWEEKSDFVLLQEFNFTDVFKEFLGKGKRTYHFATAYVLRERNEATGVANSSSFKLVRSKTLASERSEPIVGMPKTTLFQWYDIEGKKEDLLVVNVHLINFVPTSFFIEQMVGIENVVREHKGPAVFAGDFNTWAYDLLKYAKSMMKRLDFQGVEFDPDKRKRFRTYPLDHVYVRGMKAQKAITVETLGGSDHNAMYVELVFN